MALGASYVQTVSTAVLLLATLTSIVALLPTALDL